MSMPPTAISSYEQMRAEVLRGQASPQGVAAIAYHGMLRGLAVILTKLPTPTCPTTLPPACDAIVFDRELLRLIANMVLQSQSEIQHVY